MKQMPTLRIDEVVREDKDKLAVITGEQGDVPLHDHEFFELAYVASGSALHTLDGRSERIQEGDYFIVDFGSFHSYSDSRDFTIINCLFLPEMIDEVLTGCQSFEQLIRICLIRYSKQYYGQTTVNRTFHDSDGQIRGLLFAMQEEYQNKQIGYTEVFRFKMLEILILTMRRIIRKTRREAFNGTESTPVLELIHFIDKYYPEKSLLGRFCREHHYSLQYISRRFRQETGITARDYLQNVRIEKSCALLAGSDLQIQEIAQAVGYEDVKYYNKIFRRKLQMAPGEYRKI